MKTVVSKALCAFAIFAAGLLPSAQAGTISGGSALLTPTGHAQLETWLGQGQFNLNNVFTLQPGLDADDFHGAADGVGRTFALMLVGDGVNQWLVGGYNPQSWDSLNHWHETPDDKDRVAFVFNMTSGSVFRQIPSSYILPSQGEKQTFNSELHGPAFGEGGDLWVTGDLQHAYSWLFSYGDPAMQGLSLIDGAIPEPLPAMMTLHAMEIFTIAAIPEPSSAAMMIAGMLVLASVLSRRRKHPVNSANV
ncbi:MAG TPA: PEP_CTERM-anchored TLD domain-containing protein [Telluria sp.]|nr:PEP_CTERM-anchored TLD domain-containing protein [Telluria sp.]